MKGMAYRFEPDRGGLGTLEFELREGVLDQRGIGSSVNLYHPVAGMVLPPEVSDGVPFIMSSSRCARWRES